MFLLVPQSSLLFPVYATTVLALLLIPQRPLLFRSKWYDISVGSSWPSRELIPSIRARSSPRPHRPGATEISAEEEISRVVPVIEGIRDASPFAKDGQGVTISVDTRRAAVAEAAVAAGAHAVNDVSGGRFDPEMFAAVARAEIPLIMMHMRWVDGPCFFLVDPFKTAPPCLESNCLD